MENNIEELIRKDFHKREITPSENALEHLNAKLDAQQVKPKRKKLIKFLGYVASIVGLIFILQLVLQEGEVPKTQEEVNTAIGSKDTTTIPVIEDVVVVKQFEEAYKNNVEKESIKTTKVRKKIEASFQEDSMQDAVKGKVAEVKTSIVQSNHKNTALYGDTITVKEATDAELDALLAEASLTLVREKGDSIVVNSKSMLYEIEVEINKPLPEKVYLTLKTGATTLKELVKTNNNKQ